MIYDYLSKKEKYKKNCNFINKEKNKFNNNISLFYNFFFFVIFGIISMTLYSDFAAFFKSFDAGLSNFITNEQSTFFKDHLSTLSLDYISIKDNITETTYSLFSLNNAAKETIWFMPFENGLSLKNNLLSPYLFSFAILILPVTFIFQAIYSSLKTYDISVKLILANMVSFILVIAFVFSNLHYFFNNGDDANYVLTDLIHISVLFNVYSIITVTSFFFLCLAVYRNFKYGRFNEKEYKKIAAENKTLYKIFSKMENEIINSEENMNIVLDLYKNADRKDDHYHWLADLISDFNYYKNKELEKQNKINNTKILMNEYFHSSNKVKEQNLMQND